jgi:hypothetical protein
VFHPVPSADDFRTRRCNSLKFQKRAEFLV